MKSSFRESKRVLQGETESTVKAPTYCSSLGLKFHH